jgi:hypothetical protein
VQRGAQHAALMDCNVQCSLQQVRCMTSRETPTSSGVLDSCDAVLVHQQ